MATMYQIGKTSTVIGKENDFEYVQYHATKVVKWNNEIVILNSGGWHTSTTKNRMNQTSNVFNLDFQVYQKDYLWFVSWQGKELDFFDGIQLSR